MDSQLTDMDLLAAWQALQATQQPDVSLGGPPLNAEASSSTIMEIYGTGMVWQTGSGNYSFQNSGQQEETQDIDPAGGQEPASGKTTTKRKQNTSCDACRIRRVKCDLHTLLESPSSSESVSCTKCTAKGIRCTTTKIQNVRQPNRTGRRIMQAKALAGSVDDTESVASSSLPRMKGNGLDQQNQTRMPGWTPQDSPFLSNDKSRPFQPSSRLFSDQPSSESTPSGFGTASTSTSSLGQSSSAFDPLTTPHLIYQSGPNPSRQQILKPNLDVVSMGYVRAMGRQERDELEIAELEKRSGYGRVVSYGSGTSESLVRCTLGTELNRHLLNTYFQSVHLQLPVIDVLTFRDKFNAANQRPEDMGPVGEVLCAAMAAWGAKYSGSPVVLGLAGYESSASKTQLEISPYRLIPGGTERLQWADAREPVCKALQTRAERMLDERGLLRNPTIDGLAAIIAIFKLYGQRNPGEEMTREEYLRGRTMEAIIGEQIEAMDMAGSIDFGSTQSFDQTLQWIRKSRTYWTGYIMDAFASAASRRMPRFEEDAMENPAQLKVLIQRGPGSTDGAPTMEDKRAYNMKVFLAMYIGIAACLREVARHVTGPIKRPAKIEVETFAKDCKRIWAMLDDIFGQYEVFALKLEAMEELFAPVFSPLNWIVHIKAGHDICYQFMHQAIRELHEFLTHRLSPASAELVDLDSPQSESEDRFAQIVALLSQSTMELFKSNRRTARTIKAVIPTGLMQTSDTALSACQLLAIALSKTPTIEQGFPPDSQGDHWTWRQKLNLVAVCVEGLYQSGWAWRKMDVVIEQVKVHMRESRPDGMPSFDDYVLEAEPEYQGGMDISIQHLVEYYPMRFNRTDMPRGMPGAHPLAFLMANYEHKDHPEAELNDMLEAFSRHR